MAKGIGLIGNFRGKVGNMVGYNLKDSNNKQTQGVRVYQPIVKNPKTYAQAEQRAKLAPVNATYRALKMIIDRGQENKAYGNKSRLAWLKQALKAFNGPWYEKGASIGMPCLIPLTDGSLIITGVTGEGDSGALINVGDVQAAQITTIGELSTALLNQHPSMHDGDQLTFVQVYNSEDTIKTEVDSLIVDTSSTQAIPAVFAIVNNNLTAVTHWGECTAATVILSRDGNDGSHLRSKATLNFCTEYDRTLVANAAKEAAIKSYMTGGSNTDWAEESLQG